MHPHGNKSALLRVLAWESTRACSLGCPHCRASAINERDPNELSTVEAIKMLKEAAKIGPAIVILSGGEPLLRNDLEEIASEAIKMGHRPVVSCNDGRLLGKDRIESLKAAGIKHFSFSMHSEKESDHDNFVRVDGAYSSALTAFENIKAAGLSFQINTTILPSNYDRIEELKNWVVALGAASWHLFFIVPTGRAAEETNEIVLRHKEIDQVLTKVAKESDDWPIPVKVTCAPQYARIREQLGKPTGSRGRSCMAGSGFAFVSWKGEVKPCGYFDMVVGNVRNTPLDQIYTQSKELEKMRTPELFVGACGKCKFKQSCGGCRARAYAVNNNYLGEDPNCTYALGQKP